jgi:DNA-3-methyladenine glycosylase
VLVRAAEPLDGWDADLSAPGKLCREMRITRALNGVDLTGDHLYLLEESPPREKIRVVRTVRIGVDYAKQWKDEPLRFVDADSDAVSHPKLHRRMTEKVTPARTSASRRGSSAGRSDRR